MVLAQYPPLRLDTTAPKKVRELGRGEWIGPMQSGAFARNRVAQWVHNPGGTTWSVTGSDRTADQLGTGVAANADTTSGPYESQTTLLSSGDYAGRISSGVVTQRSWSPCAIFRVLSGGSAQNIRVFVGLSDTDLPAGAVDTPSTQHLAVCSYSTTRDGSAFWRSITCDGTTPTINAGTVAYSTSTVYYIAVDIDEAAGAVRFWITNTSGVWVPLTTHTTNLPASTVGLRWILSVQATAGVATGKRISGDFVQLWQV